MIWVILTAKFVNRHYLFCETDEEAVNKAKLYGRPRRRALVGTRRVALLTQLSSCTPNLGPPQKITFGEMRASGVRRVLVYCSGYKCSHSITMDADCWPDSLIAKNSHPA